MTAHEEALTLCFLALVERMRHVEQLRYDNEIAGETLAACIRDNAREAGDDVQAICAAIAENCEKPLMQIGPRLVTD